MWMETVSGCFAREKSLSHLHPQDRVLETGSETANERDPSVPLLLCKGGLTPFVWQMLTRRLQGMVYRSAPTPENHVFCFPCVPIMAMDTGAIR